MAKIHGLGLALVVLAAVSATRAIAGEGIPIDVSAKVVECAASDVTLRLTLSNQSKKPLQISNSFLPWGIRDSLLLIAVTNDMAVDPLRPSLYVDDPRGGATTIPPRASIEGAVNLIERFPELQSIRKKYEVIVFWAYRQGTVDGDEPTTQEGGFVVLPKLPQRASTECGK